MKFVIDSKIFKNITERAAALCQKNGVLSQVRCVEIISDKETNKVIVKSTNMDSYSEIHSDFVRVIDNGNAFVSLENLKRLYNVVGDVTIETTEKSINIYSDRKRSETLTEEIDSIEFPVKTETRSFYADKEELLSTFSKLSCCLQDSGLYSGFNISNMYGTDRIVALDGFRGAMRKVNWNFKPSLDITIPGYVGKELKKVSANKKNETIEVFSDSKYAWFVGTDFIYTTRLLEGKYLEFEKIAKNEGSTYGFEIESEDLACVSKEYSGVLKSLKEPMYFCNVDGKLVAVAMSKDYKTSDVLDVTNAHDVPENLICAINPMYINQMSGVFNKQNIVVTVDLNKSFAPWIFTGESDYTGLILPCRPKEDLSDIRQFVQNM